MLSNQGESEAIILVKAAPQVSATYGETVCCAGVTLKKEWVRLYPVTFRSLEDAQKFGRWDRVKFRWTKPKSGDNRKESLRVDQQSLEITGDLSKRERESFLAPLEVTSLQKEAEKGNSLALLRPSIKKFYWEKKSDSEINEEIEKFKKIQDQKDLFFTKVLLPYAPCPYVFKYQYSIEDGEREGTCQDWEIEATFYKWKKLYGEEQALAEMNRVFGEEFPKKGVVFAMGTHSRFPDTWLINGVIRLDEIRQQSLF